MNRHTKIFVNYVILFTLFLVNVYGAIILSPQQAYRVSAYVVNNSNIDLRFNMANGVYLYKDSIRLDIFNNKNIKIGSYLLPETSYEKDSRAVYKDFLNLKIPLDFLARDAGFFKLSVNFQGCLEDGFCYPPLKRDFELYYKNNFSKQSNSTTINNSKEYSKNIKQQNISKADFNENNKKIKDIDSTPSLKITPTDKIIALLERGNFLITLATFFIFGLLLAITPCMLPIMPIISGLIAGQKDISNKRALVLSLCFVLAMSLAYSLVGVLAGIFGSNLQAFFQNPIFILFFSMLFVLLALAMFGSFNIQMPRFIQNIATKKLDNLDKKESKRSILSVCAMGILSALIVGPCIAPPLLASMLFISEGGSAILGGAYLFVLSFGMGVPLIFIGYFSKQIKSKLSKISKNIQDIFGFIFLILALFFLSKIIPPAISMLLYSMLFIFFGIYLGALEQLPKDPRWGTKIAKFLKFLLLLYGSILLVGFFTKSTEPLNPLKNLHSNTYIQSSNELIFQQISTLSQLDRILSSTNKTVMVYFYADWCYYCKEIQKTTFKNINVQNKLSNFILIKVDVTKNGYNEQELLKRFKTFGPPSIFFVKDGKLIKNSSIIGYINTQNFLKHIEKIK